jgi:hypothetical protein
LSDFESSVDDKEVFTLMLQMDTYHHHHNEHITTLTFLAAFALWSPGVAMLENGTSIEYLME